MTEEFTKEEVKILKRICENPIFKESQPLPPLSTYKIKPLKEIIKRVCAYYDIEEKDFLSRRRNQPLIEARRDYCHIAFKRTKKHLSVIGQAINKDHTVILYHLNKKPFNIDKILHE